MLFNEILFQKSKSNQRKYFFKFVRHDETRYRLSKHPAWGSHYRRLPDLIQSENLVHFNPEEGCYILEVFKILFLILFQLEAFESK